MVTCRFADENLPVVMVGDFLLLQNPRVVHYNGHRYVKVDHWQVLSQMSASTTQDHDTSPNSDTTSDEQENGEENGVALRCLNEELHSEPDERERHAGEEYDEFYYEDDSDESEVNDGFLRYRDWGRFGPVERPSRLITPLRRRVQQEPDDDGTHSSSHRRCKIRNATFERTIYE